MLRSDHRELRNSLVQLMWVGGGWVGGGMRANTETSRSSARARAATTMSILIFSFKRLISTSAHLTCVNFLLSILKLRQSIEFGFISNNEKFYGERKRLASDWCTHY